jgi:protein phosphatase
VPVLDLTAPSAGQLRECAEVIERESAAGIIFVHCKAGYSRSAGAVGAWLLHTGQQSTVEEVVTRLEQARPGIVIRPEIRAALRQFASTFQSSPPADARHA